MLNIKNFNLFLLLFLFINFSILPDNQIKTNETEQKSTFERETFEELMSISREQTRNIGFCIQQILQTLSSNKEQITIENRQEVVALLVQLQEFTEKLIIDIYSKNTKEALIEGVIFTNGIAYFLLSNLEKNFTDFDLSKLISQIHKKSNTNISDETLLSLVKKNNSLVKKLIYTSDRMGLTWYNLAYRKFNDLNGFSFIKNTAIVGATVFAVGYLLCAADILELNGGPLQQKLLKIVGKAPRQNAQSEWKYDTAEQVTLEQLKKQKELVENDILNLNADAQANASLINNKLNELKKLEADETKLLNSNDQSIWRRVENNEPQTIFQSIVKAQKSLQSNGIISMGPLSTISLAGICGYLLGDWYQKAQHSGEKTLEDLDKILRGSKPNKDLNSDGQEKIYFKDLVGCEELEALAKKIANFIKHPERYERAQIEEHRGILLYGPPQTGKSLFAKALRTLIQDTLGSEREMSFIDGKKYLDYGYPLDMIFKEAERLAPCILFLDEIDLIGTNREKDPKKTGQLLTCMQGIDISSKQIIVIGATNRIEQMDKALLVDGRFGKKIFIDYPDYSKRKTFLERELKKRSIKLPCEFIDHIAQETENCSYNNLRRIITEAIILSANETRIVCQEDFEKTLDTEVRKIDRGTRVSSSKAEKEIIATYQAGKAVARHILQTKQQVVKITIENVARIIKSGQTGFVFTNSDTNNSENEKLATSSDKIDNKIKLGEVFTKSNTNAHELISDEETKKECLALLAGGVAQQIMLNSSFSQCNKHDRAEAMQMIYAMISQGEKIDEKTRAKALEIKQAYEQEIKQILEQNKDLLVTIINELLEKTTIDRYDWSNIISR